MSLAEIAQLASLLLAVIGSGLVGHAVTLAKREEELNRTLDRAFRPLIEKYSVEKYSVEKYSDLDSEEPHEEN